MQITDPVADMLTRIRNANSAKHETVDVPASNLKKAIARFCWMRLHQVLLSAGQRQSGRHSHHPEVSGQEAACPVRLKRVSKPGLRIYAGADELPKVLKGLGIAIVSTSKGVMTDKKARENHIGGEVLAFVW